MDWVFVVLFFYELDAFKFTSVMDNRISYEIKHRIADSVMNLTEDKRPSALGSQPWPCIMRPPETLIHVFFIVSPWQDNCQEWPEIGLLSLWLRASQDALLGVFLLAHTCPTKMVTSWGKELRSKTQEGIAYHSLHPNYQSPPFQSPVRYPPCYRFIPTLIIKAYLTYSGGRSFEELQYLIFKTVGRQSQ